ncbi:MAG: 3-dehydroquinate synthase [Chloroherpetonaceae bacterium]|nr:3-dehydroquinate synthase [Chloroherpetonaceae bacterium]
MKNIFVSTPALSVLGKLFREYRLRPKAALLFDSTTEKLFQKKITQELKHQAIEFKTFTVKSGEKSKSLRTAESLYSAFLKEGIDRSYTLIACGGGVVGDLGGFVAASYMRGLPLIQMPTTLLGMVDSAIGGKTAVNLAEGKNLIGFFYEPSFTLIEPEFLKTLEARDIVSGCAEILKYALILDAPFLTFLESHFEKLLKLTPPYTHQAIRRSAQLKSRVVRLDLKETLGIRAKLNFGHTFAHAIETIGNYSGLRHGEAVLVGMLCATYLSDKTMGMKSREIKRIEAMVSRFTLPKSILTRDFLNQSPEALIAAMQSDKKKSGKQLRFVLLSKIGSAKLSESQIPFKDVSKAIDKAKQFLS